MGLYQVVRCPTKSQCTQIIVLYHRNRIPRVCVILRWYQTAEKEGTSDSRNNATKSVKELPRFLGIVQYFRDIRAQLSKILAPLSNLVGECGHTKHKQNQKGAMALKEDPPAGV